MQHPTSQLFVLVGKAHAERQYPLANAGGSVHLRAGVRSLTLVVLPLTERFCYARLKRFIFYCALLLITSLLFIWPAHKSFAQQQRPVEGSQAPATKSKPTPSPIPSINDDEDIVRVTTNLVQVDAVVTDSTGKQVTDLTANDFEILEDGKRQQITEFSFIANQPGAGRPNSPEGGAPVSPAYAARTQDHHTIVIVVDDLLMSFVSANETRRAIHKFIETLMPGDQVAVVRTSVGVGALQQFTSDKEHLYAAIEHVRGTGQSELELLRRCQNNSSMATLTPPTSNAEDAFDAFYQQSSFIGTLGALNFIVRGLKEVPGRKALVLFSEGLVACPNELSSIESTTHERLRRIADLANRASVVVYSIDPRGLVPFDSATEPGMKSGPASLQRLSDISSALLSSQQSFRSLVDSTGGFPTYNNNDMIGALRRVVEDQGGYYLLGYRPGDSTFDSRKGVPHFNSLKVTVKRPGLSVRTRSGFFGFADVKGRPIHKTRDDQLLWALSNPFSTGSIDVRLTSLFDNESDGSLILSLLHINPAGLTFTPQPDGWQQAIMDVLAITFDADGQIIEQVNKTQTIRARGNAFQRLLKNGFVYSLSVPVKKPGAYQLRIAVRDAASEQLGSASQFVEVPDLSKNRLTLSGIAVRTDSSPETQSNSPVNSALSSSVYEPQSGPAFRRFKTGSVLEYDYAIYNATVNGAPPQLKTKVTVSRNGQEVLSGQEKDLFVPATGDLARLKAAGRLLLGKSLPAGEYQLKVTVVDMRARPELNRASQIIDFEIF